MKLISVAIPLVFLQLTGYGQTKSNDTAQHVNMDTLTVTAPAGAKPYRASTTKEWEFVHTRVALTFDMKGRTAGAREWVKLHPYQYETDSIVLDAKSMKIDSVQLCSRKGNTPLRYTYEDNQLKISFDKKYQRKDTIELYFRYTAMPYETPKGGSAAITDDKGLYFINTDNAVPHKPVQIWTQGETESNSHWMITVDKPNTRFTTQIELTVPDTFVTLSNGALVKQQKAGAGLRTDIWRMDLPIQAYATMFAIGKYNIIKNTWNGKDVNYYVEPEYGPYARLIFKNTPEMMSHFSKRTGVPYPWNKYDQVVVRDYISGAMENTTASIFGEFVNGNGRELGDKNSEDIVAHELFHQWFGDYVTCESWSNLTVNESFANYGEQLWRRFKYGRESSDELAYNDLTGYLGAATVSDPTLVRFNYDSREEMFDAISYNKGGAILHYLNSLMGDDAFDRAMNIYLTRNALHSAEAHNWRLAVEEATGKDWNWFFDEWYYHAGHPSLKINYNYDDNAKVLGVSVSQVQSDSTYTYQLPLKTAILYGGVPKVIDWNINKRKDTFTYAYKNGVRPVIIPDFDHVLVGDIKENKKPEQWLVQYNLAEDFISKRLAVAACGKNISDSSAQVVLDRALSDRMPSIRRVVLQQLRNAGSDKYHKKWADKIIAMANNDTSVLVRADAFSVLSAWKEEKGLGSMYRAVYDSSYAVAGAALDALNRINKDTAYYYARQLAVKDPRGALDNIVWSVIGAKAAPEDIGLFEERAPYVMGSKKFSFSFSLNNYLKNVKSEDAFKRGMATFTTMVVNETMKSYRTALSGSLVQLLKDEKSDTKSDIKEDADKAQKRMEEAKAAVERVISKEREPEALKDLKDKLKKAIEP